MPVPSVRPIMLLSLTAFLAGTAATRAADDVVVEERPPAAAPQPPVRMRPQVRVQVQQMQQVPPAAVRPPEAGAVRREPYLGIVTGAVSEALRAQLGLPEGIGLVVEAVAADGPAGRGGVKRFDILRKLDDQMICTADQLSALVKAAGKGKEVALTLTRGGQEAVVKVQIDEREVPAPRPGIGDVGVGVGVLPLGVDALFAEVFPDNLPGIGDDVRAEVQRQVQEALEQAQAGGVGEPGGAQARVIQIYPGGSSQSVTVVSDEEGSVEIREADGVRTVTIKDPTGSEVYAGPLDTDADRELIPETLRERVRRVESQAKKGRGPAVRPIPPPQPAESLPADGV